MKVTVALAVVVLALAVLWTAGEQHRKNCLTSGKVDCSVLPWEGGKVDTCNVALPSAECILGTEKQQPRNRFLEP